ncbi:putative GPI anchor protein [Phytophthora cinnamomi]|uniref:putative GPI anchor protein n=1 Tax=Phytophthora cinnamomi TaxID=4785 RepID=UPI0035598F44|nr:putative GPI anchor protein [Phytophthora cinnamomi]
MVRVFLALGGSLAVAAQVAVTVATSVSFVNDCAFDISLYDNNATETIAVGGSTSRELADGFSGMFRNGTSSEATLAEFAISGGKAWYALSAVPPGAGNCTSYADCAATSGKTGFNVAMAITPDVGSTSVNAECAAVTCSSADCDGAYLYPTDTSKLRNCPDSLAIEVAFCPDGSSNSTSTSTSTTSTTTTTTTVVATDAPVATTEAPVATTAAPVATTAAPVATTAAPVATTATPESTTAAPVASDADYSAGVVSTDSPSSTSTSSTTSTSTASTSSTTSSSSTTSTSTTKTTSSGSTGDFSSATISSSFEYSGTNAGSATGTYGKVTAMSSCSTEDVSVTDPVGPMSEEVTMVFRGPMNIYNIAVFSGSSGNAWTKVSSYDASAGTQDNMVFMNNMNIDYTGADSSPQGYSTADGSATATESTIFGGSLADASDTSVTGGGPCVSTGCEVNIMTSTNCADEDGCIGYYDDMGFHGWDGGMKMFVTKVQMPTGSTANLPAIWMLNAQVVRASQYGCNCRGSGSVGGCGELDVAEVIETNTAQDKVSTHYYFYDGSVSPGGDNYAARPTDSAVTYVTIYDNSGEGVVKIIEIGGDDFDFSVDSVSADTVSTWLSASVENLIS